jgi:DNA-3-methyladenine glycosylase
MRATPEPTEALTTPKPVGGPGAGSAEAAVDRAWFGRPALEVAPDLLGAVLARTTADGTVAVRLTEVEAYEGPDDPGSHGYRGRTPRTAVMFGPPGHLYVYFTYGMHWCANIVCGQAGEASAVLLRAGEVIQGTPLARVRRPSARSDRDLARGPARLATALGIGREHNGADLCEQGSALVLSPGRRAAGPVLSGPRVGLAQAADRPWRFWLAGESTVSPYRAHVPRRRSAG